MKIYTTTPTKRTITGFIKALYSDESLRGKAMETFLDEACTQRECKPARRSFEDLVAIVQTRYPKTSEKRIAKACKQLCDRHGFIWHICTSIRKPVLYLGSVRMDIEVYPEFRLSEGWGKEEFQRNAKYKWQDLHRLMEVEIEELEAV